jgi:hypothetical protein
MYYLEVEPLMLLSGVDIRAEDEVVLPIPNPDRLPEISGLEPGLEVKLLSTFGSVLMAGFEDLLLVVVAKNILKKIHCHIFRDAFEQASFSAKVV